MEIYYIGGSPCSGKSTVAEALAKRCGLTYFKTDDYLDELIDEGADAGLPVCRRIRSMSAEETWMRPPQVQCREELDFYEEVSGMLLERLNRLQGGPVITEGAAFLPEVMKAWSVPPQRYIAITPTREFQFSRYRERPWVPHVLRDCSDREAAFRNWMERDALFAEDVREQCSRADYLSLLTDGSGSPEARLDEVAAHFGLNK